MILATLTWPAVSAAEHIVTAATVSAQVTERKSTDFWVVEIDWTAACSGAAPGTAWYDGDLYMIDADTGERNYVGGVVDTSGQRTVSGKKEWYVSSLKRSRRLFPELTIGCFENFPLHGGSDVVVTGSTVIVPPSFGSRSGGGGSGGGKGAGGRQGDPTSPLAAGGCIRALLGTDGADVLAGGDEGEVIIGFAAADRIRGSSGHDCLLGGAGNDRIEGELGNDRLTGEGGKDVLVDRKGVNSFDAGAGNDRVDARNGKRELVRCGSGRDLVRADDRDRLRGCELVTLR